MANIPTKEEIDSYARSHGFPDSDYPYAEHINTCGSSGLSAYVPDGWYCVSFETACMNHDRCYITLGSDRDQCDKNFLKDLRTACKRYILTPWKQPPYIPTPSDIAIYIASGLPWVTRPPIVAPGPMVLESLERAYRVANLYYLAVRASGGTYFEKSQELAKRYTAFVENFISCRLAAPTQPGWLSILLNDESLEGMPGWLSILLIDAASDTVQSWLSILLNNSHFDLSPSWLSPLIEEPTSESVSQWLTGLMDDPSSTTTPDWAYILSDDPTPQMAFGQSLLIDDGGGVTKDN